MDVDRCAVSTRLCVRNTQHESQSEIRGLSTTSLEGPPLAHMSLASLIPALTFHVHPLQPMAVLSDESIADCGRLRLDNFNEETREQSGMFEDAFLVSWSTDLRTGCRTDVSPDAAVLDVTILADEARRFPFAFSLDTGDLSCDSIRTRPALQGHHRS